VAPVLPRLGLGVLRGPLQPRQRTGSVTRSIWYWVTYRLMGSAAVARNLDGSSTVSEVKAQWLRLTWCVQWRKRNTEGWPRCGHPSDSNGTVRDQMTARWYCTTPFQSCCPSATLGDNAAMSIPILGNGTAPKSRL
jgi:hypothetical protein